MKRQDKKNYMKLLPAAAVIAAVTVTGVQGKTGSTQKVQSESADVKDAEELTGLLTTAYSYDEFSDGTSSSKKSGTASKKAKKSGIKKGTAKTLPDESQKTTATGQGSTSTPTTSIPEGGYKDGTYQGSGTGFGGTITVQVTIADGKIAAIDILSASGETSSYFASAQGVISKIISGQTPNVDAVSGATYSSNGIIQAVQNALSQAANDSTVVSTTPTPTATPTPKPTSIPKPAANTTYKDGTYSAEAEGFDGAVKVTITIKNGKITKITNTNTDTKEYFSKAWSKIQPAILKKQGVYGVDTVSGATFSSNGILEATQKALAKAETTAKPTAKPTDAPTPTEGPAPTVTPDTPVSEYQDGTYTGKARGYSGFVTITLTIKDGRITEIANTNTDTGSYFRKAWKVLQPAILEKQSADGIDTVSGATYSSSGILGGAQQALESAKITETPTETPTPTITPEVSVTPTPAPTMTPEATPTPEPTAVPTEIPTPEPTEEPAGKYRDGTYTGSGSGNYGAGSVTVTVTISGGQIVEASYGTLDDEGYFDEAWNSIYNQVMGSQSADGLDTVSGATFSSQGIIQAFQNALSQAQN
nr:FMN-binding protein [uncultured Blautia sp.]